MRLTFSRLLSLTFLVVGITSLHGYAQVIIVDYGDFLAETDSQIIASTAATPIGTASDGSATTYLYEKVDIKNTEVNGALTKTTQTVEGTLIVSASGFQLMDQFTDIDNALTLTMESSCESGDGNNGACSAGLVQVSGSKTTTVGLTTKTGSASTLVLPVLSSAASKGNNNAGSSISISKISVIGMVALGILSGALIL